MAIERALISVYDKTGVMEFARELASLGVEIISTGGTAKLVARSGHSPSRDVAELTGWPEMLGGRVKTLHPKVHGGILFQRGKPEDRKQAGEHSIVPIDLVVVNLYPFSATAAKPGVTRGGADREYRHRRTGHGSVGGEKFPERRRGDRCRRLRGDCWRSCAKSGN